jgi:rhamnosyltransferase
MKIRISLIIPTINFARGIGSIIEKARQQSVSIHEIIVVDSSSEDNTADIARGLGVKVLSIPREEFDHGGTRTIAAKAATGDVLVFITQDILFSDRLAICKLLNAFMDANVVAAYGRQLPSTDADIFGQALRFFNYPNKSYVRNFEDRFKYGIKTPFLSNSFAAYFRKALEEIGWFKDGLILGEDTYAGAKLLMAGYKVAYVADAVVEHSHNYTPWQDFKRYFDIGVFHTREHWILETFGNAEGEGLRFIGKSLRYLVDNGAALRIPEFFWRTALKFIGYRLGRNYSMLRAVMRKSLSMHSGWWNKHS